jgi:hypothetical protein
MAEPKELRTTAARNQARTSGGMCAPIAFSELKQSESTSLSGFFLKKTPPFTALNKSVCIPKMLWGPG